MVEAGVVKLVGGRGAGPEGVRWAPDPACVMEDAEIGLTPEPPTSEQSPA